MTYTVAGPFAAENLTRTVAVVPVEEEAFLLLVASEFLRVALVVEAVVDASGPVVLILNLFIIHNFIKRSEHNVGFMYVF